MKIYFAKYFLIVLLMCSFTISKSQVITIDDLLKEPITNIPTYNTPNSDENIFILNCDYASHIIKNEQAYDVLKEEARAIKKIDFVYTTFKLFKSFNQQKLNKKRLEEFQEIAPEVFNNENIV